MQPTPPAEPGTLVRHTGLFRRFVYIYAILLALLLLALLPPLITVNRLKHRIATSISQSLGRPVHLDSVSLNLLPTPGFELHNLVVSEDPAFGSEPIIRASTVTANLRFRSLWTRRVEFSSISFADPSVNLVHLSNGKWNLESILLQAAHINAAPTAQRTAGPAPRFPYIEATGARINLKSGDEKTPFSLTGADFALWLPSPRQWHLRMAAQPARTDTSASDTGTFRIEGTLGRATSLDLVPIDLFATWDGIPLGEASLILLGHDAYLRGDMDLSAHALGTIGNSALTTRLRFNQVRRADFVPPNPLNLDLTCTSTALNAFHTFPDVHCAWPTASTSPNLTFDAALGDIRAPDAFTAAATAAAIPAHSLLDWLHVASSRVPAATTATGQFSASMNYGPHLTGWLHLDNATLGNPHLNLSPIAFGPLALQSPAAPVLPAKPSRRKPQPPPPPAPDTFVLTPTTIALGGKEPAVLEGRVDSTGYTLHVAGMMVLSRLEALAEALPPLGDGLKPILPTNRASGPVRLDLTATRLWSTGQTWQQTASHPTPAHTRRKPR